MSKVNLQQIPLISAICSELNRQSPGISVNPRQYNALVKAANEIIATMEVAPVPATPDMGISAWFECDDVGASSKYMACVLDHRPIPAYAHPHDADDFERCVKLLAAAPELRNSFRALARKSPEWRAIVENWDSWVMLRDTDGFYEVLHEGYKSARNGDAQ